MIEKKEITKRIIKNMIINFIIFTVILVIFDFIIYNNIVLSLYKDVDVQLEDVMRINDNIEPLDKGDRIELDNKKVEKIPDNDIIREEIISPRLVVIERDENRKYPK